MNRRVRAVAASAVALLTALGPATPALAWKPRTHIYLAEEAMRDALDDGKVTLHEIDPATGRVVGVLGEFDVDPKVAAALRAAPQQFRAGVLGPDAYPDILTGQQIIHPDEATPPGSGTSGSDAWLSYVYERGFVGSSSPEVNAFAVGYLTHAAGDVFAHTLVNHFAGGEFALSPKENAIKHLTLEGYIGQRTPATRNTFATTVATGTPCSGRKRDDLGLDPGEECGVTRTQVHANVTQFDTSIAGVEDFIYRNMVFAQPGTPLMQRLLRGEGTSRSVPWLFSNLRNGLQQKVNEYETRVAGLTGPARIAYQATGGPVAAYQRAWIEDIDNGLKAWPAASHEIATALVYNEGGSDLTKAREAIGRYQRDHLFSMAGTPDVAVITVGMISDMISAILPGPLSEVLRQVTQAPLDLLVLGASGMTPDQWADYLGNPHRHFDEVMNKAGGAHGGASDHRIDLATFNRDHLKIEDGGYANPSLKWKTEDLPAAFNTLQLTKMTMLGASGRQQLAAALEAKGAPMGAAPNGSNLMLGWVRSLDAGNQWQGLPSKQGGASPKPGLSEAAWRKLFMRQVGETGADAAQPPQPAPEPTPAPQPQPQPGIEPAPQPAPTPGEGESPVPEPTPPSVPAEPPTPMPAPIPGQTPPGSPGHGPGSEPSRPPTSSPQLPSPGGSAGGFTSIARNWAVKFDEARAHLDSELHVYVTIKNLSNVDLSITPGNFIPVLLNQDGEGLTSRAVYRVSGDIPTEFRPTVPSGGEVRVRFIFRPDPNTAQPRTFTIEVFGERKLTFDVSTVRLGSLVQ